jgi:glycosyltransferase involved in cell wall biosynthesis
MVGVPVSRLVVARRGRLASVYGREAVALRSATAALRLTGHRNMDGLLQLGTHYLVRSALPRVVLLDMTVPQGLRAEHPLMDGLARRERDEWVALQRRVLDSAVACCTFTRWAADSAVHDLGVAPQRVHVVGAGRNVEPLGGAGAIERDWSRPRFLLIARDWRQKDGDRVLRAFTRVRAKVREMTLDVVGGHPRLDLPGVTGHGVLRPDRSSDRTRLAELLALTTCLVMPSPCEPFGIAHVEAAAAGAPSIASAVGGAREAIGEDGGIVVAPGDDEALAVAMVDMADPDRARRAGAAARRHAARFTWPAVARRILASFDAQGVVSQDC